MGLPIILITAITFSMCNICKSYEIKTVTVLEGDHFQLDFPYPCDCTRVTLQYGLRIPFYTLTDSEWLSLPSDQENRFTIKYIEESNGCALHLAIDPVIRNDAGTYKCLAYGADQERYIYRVGLDVDFPPGKVSCTPSEDHTVGTWAALRCTAPVGRLAGQIDCYQNEERMPPIAAPIENDWHLKQTILVTKDGYPVFCCASVLDQTKDRCECSDLQWDFDNGKPSSSINDPCGFTTEETMVKIKYPHEILSRKYVFISIIMGNFVTITVVIVFVMIKIKPKSMKKLFTNTCSFMYTPVPKHLQPLILLKAPNPTQTQRKASAYRR